MKIIVTPSDLAAAMTRAASVAGKSESNAVHACVLIDATPERVRLTSMSDDAAGLTLVLDLPANVQEEGVVAVNAADLLKTAKALPGAVAVLSADEFRLTLQSNFTTFRLPVIDADTFPQAPALGTSSSFTIAASDLRRVIDQTLFSVAPDDNRYGLNGAHIEPAEASDGAALVRFVSTDGNRLSWAQARCEGGVDVPVKSLMPRRALIEARKIIETVDGPVEVASGERAFRIRIPNVLLHVRAAEGDFPDYRAVVPETFTRRVLVDRDALHSAVKRVGVFAGDSAHTMLFALAAESVDLSARKVDHGEGTESLPAGLAGEPITIGLSAKFAAETLAAVRGERVEIQLNDALGAVAFRSAEDDDALFIVMPLRVDA